MSDLKQYRGVIFHDIEGWCKIWRKTDLWFGKWHEEYGKFPPEQFKVSKLGWWDPLIQSRKSMSLKSTEELCVMTMKSDAKSEVELTCQFKVGMRNLMNCDPSTWKSQKLSFSCAPFEKSIYCLSLKSTEELSFMKLKRDTKFVEESTCCFQIGITNLTKFDSSTRKSQKFSF